MPPTPNEVYSSNETESGGFFAKVYRGKAAPVLLGTYLIESADPTPETVEVNRPHVDGGDNGFKWVDGKKEGPITAQRAANAATLKTGDFFKTSVISFDAAGAGETEIYAIKSPSQTTGAGYRSQSATMRQEKFPTAAQLAIDEYAE